MLAGRSAFFAILDQLSPRRCLDICVRLQVCPSLAQGSQLLRYHRDRRSPKLDALIAQHLLIPSSSPSPPLLLSPIQKSEAAYRAAQLRYQPTYHDPRKREQAPDSDAQDSRPAKRQRLSVGRSGHSSVKTVSHKDKGDEDSDDEDAVLIVTDGRHQNPLSIYAHRRAPWRPHPQYLYQAAATGIPTLPMRPAPSGSGITQRVTSSHVVSGSSKKGKGVGSKKRKGVGSKAIPLGIGAVKDAAAGGSGVGPEVVVAREGASQLPSALGSRAVGPAFHRTRSQSRT